LRANSSISARSHYNPSKITWFKRQQAVTLQTRAHPIHAGRPVLQGRAFPCYSVEHVSNFIRAPMSSMPCSSVEPDVASSDHQSVVIGRAAPCHVIEIRPTMLWGLRSSRPRRNPPPHLRPLPHVNHATEATEATPLGTPYLFPLPAVILQRPQRPQMPHPWRHPLPQRGPVDRSNLPFCTSGGQSADTLAGSSGESDRNREQEPELRARVVVECPVNPSSWPYRPHGYSRD